MRPIIICLAAAALSGFAVSPGKAQSAGRLLASNCFQCHGTNGHGGFEAIAGESASEIYEELKEMQGNPATSEGEKQIMAVHANGYSDAELHLIAKFFASK
jgi:cytochrome c553